MRPGFVCIGIEIAIGIEIETRWDHKTRDGDLYRLFVADENEED